MSDTADAFMAIFGFHRVTTDEDATMIFTQEQIERLPGSVVKLRDGREVRLSDEPADFFSRHWSRLHAVGGRCVAANISQHVCSDPADIIEVIRWADEPAKQPTTIREWLETIEDEGARKRALELADKRGGAGQPMESFKRAIVAAFTWHETHEGADYWSDFYVNGPACKPAKQEATDQLSASWQSLARHFQAELRSARSDKAALLNSMQEAVSSMQRAINNARMLTPHPDRMSAEATEMLREIMEGGE